MAGRDSNVPPIRGPCRRDCAILETKTTARSVISATTLIECFFAAIDVRRLHDLDQLTAPLRDTDGGRAGALKCASFEARTGSRSTESCARSDRDPWDKGHRRLWCWGAAACVKGLLRLQDPSCRGAQRQVAAESEARGRSKNTDRFIMPLDREGLPIRSHCTASDSSACPFFTTPR